MALDNLCAKKLSSAPIRASPSTSALSTLTRRMAARILYIHTVFAAMESPAPPHVVHKYRYLDAKTGRWKMTRHHMSAEAAEQFFAPDAATHFRAEKWEAVESTREDRGSGHPMQGKGIDCNPPKSAPPPPARLKVEEVRAIWERNKCPDVRRLIWEIWYLRSTVEYARYVAGWLEEIDIDPPFDRRFKFLQAALTSHPSPAELEWSSAEIVLLKRLAKARR